MKNNIAIDFEDLKSIVSRCNSEQKLELIEMLEADTFSIRFPKLLEKMRATELSLDEITAEVETVRSERMNGRKKS